MSSAANIQVCCIDPSMLGDVWPHAGPFLLKGQLEITPDMQTALNALLECVLNVHQGKALVWAIFDGSKKRVVASLVTELIAENGEKYVWVSRMGGESIFTWGATLSDALAEYAKDESAKAVRFVGRTALRRVYSNVHCIGKHGSSAFIYERVAA